MKSVKVVLGQSFSGRKLYKTTKEFFVVLKQHSRESFYIQGEQLNYTIFIRNNILSIRFSDNCTERDYEKVGEYVKTLVDKDSIEIYGCTKRDFNGLFDIPNIRFQSFDLNNSERITYDDNNTKNTKISG